MLIYPTGISENLTAKFEWNASSARVCFEKTTGYKVAKFSASLSDMSLTVARKGADGKHEQTSIRNISRRQKTGGKGKESERESDERK